MRTARSRPGLERVWDAIAQSLGEGMRVANAIMGSWSQPTVLAMEQVELPAAAPCSPSTVGQSAACAAQRFTTRSPIPSRAAARRSGDNRVTRRHDGGRGGTPDDGCDAA